MLVVLHSLAAHRCVPLFYPLSFSHITDTVHVILEVNLAGMLAHYGIIIAQLICSLKVDAAMLFFAIWMLPLVQLHFCCNVL